MSNNNNLAEKMKQIALEKCGNLSEERKNKIINTIKEEANKGEFRVFLWAGDHERHLISDWLRSEGFTTSYDYSDCGNWKIFVQWE